MERGKKSLRMLIVSADDFVVVDSPTHTVVDEIINRLILVVVVVV